MLLPLILAASPVLTRHVNHYCRPLPKGCHAQVLSCYKEITRDLAKCKKRYPKKLGMDSRCVEITMDYGPLNLDDIVHLCSGYVIEPGDSRK